MEHLPPLLSQGNLGSRSLRVVLFLGHPLSGTHHWERTQDPRGVSKQSLAQNNQLKSSLTSFLGPVFQWPGGRYPISGMCLWSGCGGESSCRPETCKISCVRSSFSLFGYVLPTESSATRSGRTIPSALLISKPAMGPTGNSCPLL